MNRTPTPPATSGIIATHIRHRIAAINFNADLIGWVQAGTKKLFSADREFTIKTGQVFLISRGSHWGVLNDPAPHSHYQALVFQLGYELIQQFHQLYATSFTLQPLENGAQLVPTEEIQQSMTRAAKALRSDAYSTALQQHRMMEVLLLLAEQGLVFAPITALSWSDRLRHHINQRPDADWSINMPSEFFHMSASTLRRRLEHDGTTIGQLIREVRLDKALLLLQSTRLPVGEISMRCGYESHSRFSAAFRTRFGFAPSDLRAAAE